MLVKNIKFVQPQSGDLDHILVQHDGSHFGHLIRRNGNWYFRNTTPRHPARAIDGWEFSGRVTESDVARAIATI